VEDRDREVKRREEKKKKKKRKQGNKGPKYHPKGRCCQASTVTRVTGGGRSWAYHTT
jgi:hypothetical protein